MKKTLLENKKVTIINKESEFYNEWGIIKGYDGEYYHIALWNGEDQLIFNRNEFKINKK